MNRHRTVLRRCHRQLRQKNLGLFSERGAPQSSQARVVGTGGIQYPPIDAYFPDCRLGLGCEACTQGVEPGRRPVTRVPRVQPVARTYEGVALREATDAGPVGFAGAVNHHVGDAELAGGLSYTLKVLS
jgi:hypothetical protein